MLTNPENLEDNAIKHSVEVLGAFSHVAAVPVTLYDSLDNVIWECQPEKRLCSIFPSRDECCAQCTRNLALARQTAINIEEPYLFLCKAGMIKFAYPLIVNNVLKGTFFIGPVAMGNSKGDVIIKLLRRIAPIDEYIATLMPFLERLDFRTPREINYLHEVLCNCVLSNRLLENTQNVADSDRQQSESSDSEQVQKLIYLIKTGDQQSALEAFRTCYEKLYLMDAGNLNRIKIHLSNLFADMSSSLPDEDMLSVNYEEAVNKITMAFSFAEVYGLSENLVKQLTSISAAILYLGNSPIIREAVEYINRSYRESLDLKNVAAAINVNPSYLSTLFKKEMGTAFSRYLSQLRLKHSIALLKDTHYSITDISMMCGFSGQSYFIKQFKEHYSMTPKEYRKKLNNTKGAF